MSYAETIILDVQFGHAPAVVSALSGLQDVGMWATEIGYLNRITLFRTADSFEALLAGRPALLESLPKAHLERIEVTGWRVICPVLAPGSHGGVYEWRCYEARPGQMGEAELSFLAALPKRLELSSLFCALVSIEGTPRIAHVWPYADLNSRAAIRAEAVASGTWPPRMAHTLSSMQSEILLPLEASIWH
ncbi:NIPSNAP family protein [Gluconobacter morbifer]|uniref:NIPSNAP domain-containing protein n=1 Tax=Gluconobacter morbifer G707 TaxID=1088869 RepID=G6XLS1_9PROT|nr:NIPSNAP family protein [Gluconobacter morbifer]EHH67326.1 hypothetical protein GMO_23200 [Gluconobacter morbifer G707]